MIQEAPRPPAAAYEPMARILGDAYFLTHPPESGVRLAVTGSDGVRTYWDVNQSAASSVMRKARKRNLGVTAHPYTAPPKRTTP